MIPRTTLVSMTLHLLCLRSCPCSFDGYVFLYIYWDQPSIFISMLLNGELVCLFLWLSFCFNPYVLLVVWLIGQTCFSILVGPLMEFHSLPQGSALQLTWEKRCKPCWGGVHSSALFYYLKLPSMLCLINTVIQLYFLIHFEHYDFKNMVCIIWKLLFDASCICYKVLSHIWSHLFS